ncbi:unnamed protein product [Cylicocyclus nassatus]|uniref:L-lactate dehydrogenase n=1 Tax=Cylicocyclus nassatus TaxID=53992 RepID=A0AA36H8A2_CYLNA|nr:unnamed protein product [Cylicocyclus nassatus]
MEILFLLVIVFSANASKALHNFEAGITTDNRLFREKRGYGGGGWGGGGSGYGGWTGKGCGGGGCGGGGGGGKATGYGGYEIHRVFTHAMHTLPVEQGLTKMIDPYLQHQTNGTGGIVSSDVFADTEEEDDNMEKTVERILHRVAPVSHRAPQKITIVGTGAVGMACAYSILQQNVCSELCLIDMFENKVQGEMMDLQHGQSFIGRCIIKADTKYEITAQSRLCIITAGLRQKEGETRLSLVQRNTDVFKKIIPELVKYSPDTIMLVVSNPVDVLTYVTWKLSGLPQERVFGSGTNLDSARFRFLISEKFNIAASSCHGWIIGEHGDSSVPVWSGVNVAGISLAKVSREVGKEEEAASWEADLHQKVIDSAYKIIKLKGYTCWGIGLSVAAIAKGITRNSHKVYALSVNVKGIHGINDDVFLSLPCVLGMNGITHIVRQNLVEKEVEKLHNSWKTLYEVQNQIKF